MSHWPPHAVTAVFESATADDLMWSIKPRRLICVEEQGVSWAFNQYVGIYVGHSGAPSGVERAAMPAHVDDARTRMVRNRIPARDCDEQWCIVFKGYTKEEGHWTQLADRGLVLAVEDYWRDESVGLAWYQHSPGKPLVYASKADDLARGVVMPRAKPER